MSGQCTTDEDLQPKKPHFNHIVFSGGGMKGIVYIGALRYLIQEGLDKYIKNVAGSSIGAYFATAFVLGIPTEEMVAYSKSTLNENNNLFTIPITRILNIHETLGLNDGAFMVTLIAKYAQSMTFMELTKKTGKNLIVCATHVASMAATYFSVDTTPHVRVLDAVMASMAIPGLIKPVQIGDDYYIDGCVSVGTPIQSLPKNIRNENILILSIGSNTIPKPLISGVNLTLMSYAIGLIESLISTRGISGLLSANYPYYLLFNDIPISAVPAKMEGSNIVFSVPEAAIEECFVMGYERLHIKMREWRA